MILTNFALSYYLSCMCNDIDNFQNYEVIDKKCYYKNEIIGEVGQKFNEENGVLDVYFRPYKKIEYITINFTITPSGADFK